MNTQVRPQTIPPKPGSLSCMSGGGPLRQCFQIANVSKCHQWIKKALTASRKQGCVWKWILPGTRGLILPSLHQKKIRKKQCLQTLFSYIFRTKHSSMQKPIFGSNRKYAGPFRCQMNFSAYFGYVFQFLSGCLQTVKPEVLPWWWILQDSLITLPLAYPLGGWNLLRQRALIFELAPNKLKWNRKRTPDNWYM